MAEAVRLALTIDTQKSAKEECKAVDALLKYCDELRRREEGDQPKRERGSVYSRLGKRVDSSAPSRGRSPAPKRSTSQADSSHRSRSSSTTRRSLSRGREVPEGEALRAALVFGEPEAPRGAQTVVWPRRFQSSPSLGIHCPFCGQRKAKRHRTLENCENTRPTRRSSAFGLVLAHPSLLLPLL